MLVTKENNIKCRLEFPEVLKDSQRAFVLSVTLIKKNFRACVYFSALFLRCATCCEFESNFCTETWFIFLLCSTKSSTSKEKSHLTLHMRMESFETLYNFDTIFTFKVNNVVSGRVNKQLRKFRLTLVNSVIEGFSKSCFP